MSLPDNLRRQARELVAARLGLDFPERRSAELDRALIRGARDSASGAVPDYLTRLAALPEGDAEWRRLAGDLTVGETHFFRDAALFETLEQRVLPSIIEARRSERVRRLRLWSAGCATGEEPYSLAILVDRLLPDLADWSVTVLATDINVAALDIARGGRYREWSFRGTPHWVRDRYFRGLGAGVFDLDRRIRRLVTLAPLNLSGASYPSPLTNTTAMDLILCRNVLMYFTPDAQRATVHRLRGALLDGGYLALSAPEMAVEGLQGLERADVPDAVLYRLSSRRLERVSPPGPLVGVDPPGWPADFMTAGLRSSAPEPAGLGGTASGAQAYPWDAGPDPWAPRMRPSDSKKSSTLPEASVVPEPAPPGTGEALLAEARALADAGRLDKARQRCQTAIAHHRLGPDAYLLLAAICQESGDASGALEAVRRALYLAPDSAPAHFLQGSLLHRRGQRRRARRSMEAVVKLLSSAAPDEILAGAEGLTAGRLLESARAHMDLP